MNNDFDIERELSLLPSCPGVYIMYGEKDKIIYIGKAKNLRRRVRQYFGSGEGKSPKILKMITRIKRFEVRTVESEEEALLLENELIKLYKPKYNTLLKDDKTYPYIKVTLSEDFPRVIMARKIIDDGSLYFGPYASSAMVKDIIYIANRVFKLRECSNMPKKECLFYNLNQCPAPCIGKIDKKSYQREIDRAVDFISGRFERVEKYLKHEMYECSKNTDYEKAIYFRDLLRSVSMLKKSRKRENKKSEGLEELSNLLGIDSLRLIEAYDISSANGSAQVGAMTVFMDGVPKKNEYKRFLIKTVSHQDDYASLREMLRRRLSHIGDKGFSPIPNLILIDGGRGQVNTAKEVLKEFNLDIPAAGMVKDNRHKTKDLIFNDRPLNIDPLSASFRLIARIQDETHRSAISFHKKTFIRQSLRSELLNIDRIGEKRAKALLSHFKSIDIIKNASVSELSEAEGMNAAAAQSVYDYFHGAP